MKRLLFFIFTLLVLTGLSAEKVPQVTEIKSEKHDDILDINYQKESYYTFGDKFIRLEFFSKAGTFNAFCKDSGGREIPLLSTSDLFSNSELIICLDGNDYNLGKSNQVGRELRRLENGAQLVYRFGNRIRFVIDFSLLSSREESPEDIIRIKFYIINESRFTHTVGIREIFDTVCGEVSSVHYTTDNNTRIRNESRFTSEEMHLERAIISSNGNVSYQFVLDGIDVSPIKQVILGNVDELKTFTWDFGFRKGRGFSNIKGYDDSAILIDWPEITLGENEKAERTFYVAAANNEEAPRGIYYVDKIPAEKIAEADAQKAKEEEEKAKHNAEKRTDVDFIPSPIKDYQLDPEYIQNLIDRIDSMQSAKDVKKDEIRRLNMELDAILEKLRRQ